MKLIGWEELPEFLRKEEISPYYDLLKMKTGYLFFKRMFDIFLSIFLLLLLFPVFLILAVIIKLDSPGPVFFRQERVTQYGRIFRIYKFRTMVANAADVGPAITRLSDSRVTRFGNCIRRYRLDEFGQLINVLLGDMTFVGTRPEVPQYVKHYSNEMLATLLLPAGVTSEASVRFKDENELLNGVTDIDESYVARVLPVKMKYNLRAIRESSLLGDIKTIGNTVLSVFGLVK